MSTHDARPPGREAEDLRALKEITRGLCNDGELPALLEKILDRALRVTKAERGFVVLREESGAVDVVVARQLNHAQIDHPAFKVSRSVILETLRTATPLILGNAKEDAAFAKHDSVVINKPLSLACLPLKVRGAAIGAIYLDSRLRVGLFSPGDTLVLELLADCAAAAIHMARLSVGNRPS